LIVTQNAAITCMHGGTVTLTATQQKVLIQGGPVLCEDDLVGAPIVGCPQPSSPGSKPCTSIVSTVPGSASVKVKVGNRGVYLSTLNGMTDGVPPAGLVVVNPGQTTAQA
jgi:hypothetical protein